MSVSVKTNEVVDVKVVDFPTDKLTVLGHVQKTWHTMTNEYFEFGGELQSDKFFIPDNENVTIMGKSTRGIEIILFIAKEAESNDSFEFGQKLTVGGEGEVTFAHTFKGIGTEYWRVNLIIPVDTTVTLYYGYF
jgi:hypothetical protein